MFKNLAKIDAVTVQYKGGAPAMADVVGGQASMVIADMVTAMPYVGAGRVRLLAACTAQRIPRLPNVPTPESAMFYRAFRQRFPNPTDDYVHMRMQLMIEALAKAVEQAGSVEAMPVAQKLEQANVSLAGRSGRMRASDHQFQQSLVVGMMDRLGAPGVPFDVEGSGYGFRVVKNIDAARAELPTTCKMQRPER